MTLGFHGIIKIKNCNETYLWQSKNSEIPDRQFDYKIQTQILQIIALFTSLSYHMPKL